MMDEGRLAWLWAWMVNALIHDRRRKYFLTIVFINRVLIEVPGSKILISRQSAEKVVIDDPMNIRIYQHRPVDRNSLYSFQISTYEKH